MRQPLGDHDPAHCENEGAGAGRRGYSVGHAFCNSNPLSRLHAHPLPGGWHSLTSGKEE